MKDDPRFAVLRLMSSGFLFFLLLLVLHSDSPAQDYNNLRKEMVGEISAMAKGTGAATGRKDFDPKVMEAMSSVPRHELVPLGEKGHAYENRPLPIGYGQTISQPYIVALMTDLLNVKPDHTVLEVGTGSGYQAAILSVLARQVYTIEIVEALGRQAASRLSGLGYRNVEVRIGDGYYGWEQHAPFDAIVVTAAASHIPPPLVRQLSPGGRMVIPVGERFQVQQLTLVEKDPGGEIRIRQLLPVAFVPLTGGH